MESKDGKIIYLLKLENINILTRIFSISQYIDFSSEQKHY